MANYTVKSFSDPNPLNVSVGVDLGESGPIDAGSGITVQFPAGPVSFTETSPGNYEGSFGGHTLTATFSATPDAPTGKLSIEVGSTNQPHHGHVGQVGTIVAVDTGNEPPPKS